MRKLQFLRKCALAHFQGHACINQQRLEKVSKAVSIWKAENGKNYKKIVKNYENIKKYCRKAKIMIYKAEKR